MNDRRLMVNEHDIGRIRARVASREAIRDAMQLGSLGAVGFIL